MQTLISSATIHYNISNIYVEIENIFDHIAIITQSNWLSDRGNVGYSLWWNSGRNHMSSGCVTPYGRGSQKVRFLHHLVLRRHHFGKF